MQPMSIVFPAKDYFLKGAFILNNFKQREYIIKIKYIYIYLFMFFHAGLISRIGIKRPLIL